MAFVTYFSGFAGTDLTPAQRSQPSRLGRPQRPQYECSNASIGVFLGLGLLSGAQARRSKFHSQISHRSKVQLAARRRGRSEDVGNLDPFKHLTPRAEDLEPGERLFQQVYRPNMRIADLPEDEQTDQEEPDESYIPKKRRGKAGWLAANQELKKDPAYGKKWVLDPRKSGPKKKRWAVGEVVDEVQDIDKNASRLRTMYKRPRFDWKDAEKDDLRTEAMSGKMAAIGNDEVWISKFLSHSGVCSRRRVKELVLQGRITVNGDVIQDPVLKIDPKKDTVAVDGKVQNLRTLDELVWVMLNKPKDILSTLEDPAGRKTVADLVPFARARRLVPIGRLERNSTGIILLTNDYEWHTVLAHPRYEMPKRYRVTVYNGAPDSQRMQALQTGLHLPDEGRPCLPLEELEVLQNDRRLGMATLGFVMKEGKYRQILRMFEFIGHPIRAVKRTQIGLVRLDKELKAGEYRMLTPKEIRRFLAALPKGVVVQGCVQALLPNGEALSAVQAAQVGLVWQTSRRVVHAWSGVADELFVDIDPWSPNEEDKKKEPEPQPASAVAAVKDRVLKMSNVVDQADDSELTLASRTQVDAWLGAYIALMGSPPLEEEEPSEAQLSALHKRVVVLGQAPYADFGVWLPFGRRTLRAQRFRSYLPVGDGSYILKEMPGPQNLLQWQSSWKVYRVALLMLGVVSLAALSLYEKTVERLVLQWPRCWGLIALAEDKARAERLEKIRRKLLQDRSNGLVVPPDWTEASPWTTCFRLLALDEEFWNEQVRHPAAAWLASGSRGAPMAPAEQVALSHIAGGLESMDTEKEDRDPRKRQSNRDKRAAKARKLKADRDELDRLRRTSTSTSSPGGGQGKGKSKGKSKDQAGVQICYSFANGTGPCGSVEPGAAVMLGSSSSESVEGSDEPSSPAGVSGHGGEEEGASASSRAPAEAAHKVKEEFGVTTGLAALEGIKVKIHSFDREGCDRSGAEAVDFLQEQPYADLVDQCRAGEIDGVHSGFPCGSFSMIRHKPGGPPAVRSLEWIYGLPTNSPSQQSEADRGSMLAIRSTVIAAEQIQSQRRRRVPEVATLENPPGSEAQVEGPAWALPELIDFIRRFECTLAYFNTCAYQQKERVRWFKPAQFGGRLGGLEGLRRKCHCTRDFKHQPLVGKERTSKAGRYPNDLALEYAKLVIQAWRVTLNLEWWRHLERFKRAELTQAQLGWIRSKEKSAMGPLLPVDEMQSFRDTKRKWSEDADGRDRLPGQTPTSKKARREEQNRFYVGGMRNPHLAVDKLTILREAGQDIARLWRSFVAEYPKAIEAARTYGSDRCCLDPEVAKEWALRLGTMLKVSKEEAPKLRDKFHFQSPLKAEFWKAWPRFAKDPDEHIHVWAVHGAPLGMAAPIPSSGGVFPPIDMDSEDPMEAPGLEDQLGVMNYRSMYDDREAAQAEIDRLVQQGYVVYATEDELKDQFSKATVSKLALITKHKESGEVKHRIIVDLLRSGGNLRAAVPERIVLPRISDLVASIRKLWAQRDPQAEVDPSWGVELFGADLADAYYHFGIDEREIPHSIAPSLDQRMLVFRAMSFGYRGAPLIMGRLTAALMRLWQAAVPQGKAHLQCYMDDPVLVMMAPLEERHQTLSLLLYTAHTFGLRLSFGKAERGLRLTWIGVTVEIDVSSREIVLVPPAKLVEETLNQLQSWSGMVPLKTLRSTTGKLSWVAGILPRARWAVSILYATIADVERDMKQNKEHDRARRRAGDDRDKTGLVPVKRLQLARTWLLAMLRADEIWRARRIPMEPKPPALAITTDASPFGVGAILASVDWAADKLTPLVAIKGKVTKNVAATLGIQFREAAGQAVLEAWMLLLAFRYWGPKVRGLRVLVRGDSTVALAIGRKMSSPSPTLNWVGGELALTFESHLIEEIILHHLPGRLNTQADHLSRPDLGGVPEGLESIPIRQMNEAWMLEARLPPPGICPELWGKSPQLCTVFDNL
eukprot:s616_g3.t1